MRALSVLLVLLAFGSIGAAPARAADDLTGLAAIQPGQLLANADIARRWHLKRQEWSNAKPYGMLVAAAPLPVRTGANSLRVELHRGDCGKLEVGDHWDDCYHGNERVELTSLPSDFLKPNSRGEYGWSIYLPADWNPKDLSQIVLGQFHQENSDHPAFQVFYQSQGGGLQVTCRVDEKRLGLGSHVRTIIPEQDLRGRWHDIKVQAYWRKKEDGYFRVFVDGQQAYDFSGRTLSGTRAYFKLGIYRLDAPMQAPDLVAYYDDIWRQ